MVAREKVYNHLRSGIEVGRILGGQRLFEEAIARDMQTSRTPVREAIRHLEKEGLVEHVAYVGTFVKQISLKEVMDIYDVRAILEGYSARVLASRITDKQIRELEEVCQVHEDARLQNDLPRAGMSDAAFHSYIVKNCGNSKITEMMASLKIQANSFKVSNDVDKKRGMLLLKYGHRRILDALKKADAKEAEEMSIMHIKEAKEDTMAALLGEQVKEGSILGTMSLQDAVTETKKEQT